MEGETTTKEDDQQLTKQDKKLNEHRSQQNTMLIKRQKDYKIK